jgi:glycosyltransferase involved in cell wall biosynthesis
MAMIDQLIKNNIDLLYYPQAETFVLDYPYIMTSWDLGHRSTYSFPEMSMNDTFELRNSFRVNALLKSTAIIVESEESKEELIKYTQVYDKKIFVLPLPYGSVVNQNPSEFESEIYLKTNKLSANNYFLYPAQFWSHKNHYNLILAFNNYLKQYKDTKLILTGSDKGNLSYIKELVKDLQLEKHIVFAGYVSDLELNILYRNAISLVFPSLLGPTNMPLLEALKIGCKVICSNLVGHMKLMGENALYFNPLDPDDISNKMIKIKTLEISTSIELQNFGEKLENIFLQIIPFRMTFGRNFDQY